MKISFHTLGCKLNYAETSTYERAFLEAGWEKASGAEDSDVCLVNTCSVTATSDAKSRNFVRRMHRMNPRAKIYVVGCSAQLRKADFEALGGVSRVFGAMEKSSVAEEIMKGHAQTPESSGLMPGPGGDGRLPAFSTDGGTCFPAYSTGERTRSFLKVQDGCDNLCAYCTVPYARGASRNVPIAQCVENARRIALTGAKEIVITGVNTGDFGKTTGESFLDLLKALDRVEGIERYRISSIEPNLLTSEAVAWMAEPGHKFQPHFHIPLQSGSDRILSLMDRRYDTAFFASRIEEIRKAMERPGGLRVFFGIDLMVGLPTETDGDFEGTMEFLRTVRPAFIHVFPYSRRPGTPAAAMKGQVRDSVRTERAAAVESLCAGLHAEFVEAHRGMKAGVLFESRDKDGMMSGYTENYIRVTRPYDDSLVGRITDAVI